MQVAALYRHPIKSHGRESIESVTLIKGQTMPFDRTWAVTHEATKFDTHTPQWARCHNFMIGARTPGLAGIWAKLDEESRELTLTHQSLEPLTFRPDAPDDVARFLDWVKPLCPEDRAQPTNVVSAGARGMTDCAFPSVSLMNIASHDAVAAATGGSLDKERWRGNIWIEGAAAWTEMTWIDRQLHVGETILTVRMPIDRCPHPGANPYTGMRDLNLEETLEKHFGHVDFGMHIEVVQGGTVTLGDKVELV
jgi:uncharacterized protein YcbX